MRTSDASEDTEVLLGTILKCPSHPAALGGVGLTGGGAPGVKPWMVATRARTEPNRSCANECDSERRAQAVINVCLSGVGGCMYAIAHSM